MKKTIIIFPGILIFSLLIANCAASATATHDLAMVKQLPLGRTAVEKKIDVGGYQLNFRYTEGVLPALVFESGAGLDSTEWTHIQDTLGGKIKNAIVSYDSPGLGESESYAGEYDIEREVVGLRKGLKTLGLADQVLLVGHSFGGLKIGLYAYKYPKSISGMLFVDASTVAFNGEETRLWKRTISTLLFNSPGAELENEYHKTMNKWSVAYPQTMKFMKNIPVSLPPCYVIAAEKRSQPVKRDNDDWRKAQEELAASCNTDLIIATGSGHLIPQTAPNLVISTIENMLRTLDTSKPIDD